MIARTLARLQERPRRLVGAFALALALAGAALAGLRIETDLFRLLPSALPGLSEVVEAGQIFGTLETAFGLLEAPSPAQAHAYADAFAREARKSPRVSHVLAGFPREAAAAAGAPPQSVFFLDDEGLAEVRRRLDPETFPGSLARARQALLSPVGARAAAWIQRDPLGLQASLGRGLSALPRPSGLDSAGYWGREVDGRYRVLVTVLPREAAGNLRSAQAFAADLRAAEEASRRSLGEPGVEGLRGGFTGGPFIAAEEAQALKGDIAGTLAISLAGVLGLFWLFFRRLRVLAALAASLGASLLLGLGLLSLYPGRLHAVTAGFAAVLCGLAVDYGIHLHNGLRHRSAESLEDLYRIVGRSVALGGVTTAAAFLALCASSFPGMREFGLAMAAGVFAALAAMTTLFVALAGPARPPGASSAPRARAAQRWEAALWRRRRALLAATAAALGAVVWFGWPRTAFEPNLRRLAAAGETWRVQEDILELFGNRLEPLLFRWQGASLAEGLEAMALLRERALGSEQVDHAETPLLFLPDPRGIRRASDALGHLDPDALCRDLKAAAAANGLVPDAFEAACGQVRDLLTVVGRPAEEASAMSLLPQALGGAWERRFVRRSPQGVDLAAYVYPRERLTDPARAGELAAALAADGPAWTMSGVGLLAGPLERLLAADLGRSTVLACAVVAAVALLGLRSPTRALLALLPAALASGATFGLLGLLGIPLNPMNFVAVPLVLGLGIDDG
ncbi:MAG: MMPL family transporter, partial [Thermodesulfobacteriota bacterium]